MLRCTIEILPGGNESRARVIGLVEIANIGGDVDGLCNYAVTLKKTPPFSGALKAAWKKGVLSEADGAINAAMAIDDDELTVATVSGFHRVKRGSYDLLFRALKACGLGSRNP